VVEKRKEIVDQINQITADIVTKDTAKTGSINASPMPNCLITPRMERNKITIQTGTGSRYVEAKLDKAIARCTGLPADEKDQCFVDNVKITQNFTEIVRPTVYSAIESAKTIDDRAEEKEDIKVLSSIERKIRTGNYAEEFVDGKVREIHPIRSEKRQALNRAKLLGKMPLDTAEWKFLSDL